MMMQSPKTVLRGLTLHVEDVERSRQYYERIPGAVLELHRPREFALLRIGDAQLGLLASAVLPEGRRQSRPAGRREAVGPLELARHVALVGEAGLGGDSRERLPTLDRGPRQRQPAQGPISVGARPERPAELASDGEAVGPRDLF